MNSSTSSWRTPLLVIIAGCLIAVLGFGARSSLGLFLEPMTATRGWSRETFSMAMAIQNLFWGIALPFAGALADKLGSRRVIIVGAVAYAIGLYGMSVAESNLVLYLTSGVLCGTAIAFSAFTLAMASMVRVVGPEKRSFVLGLGTAAGSLGQVLLSPLSQGFISAYGWQVALVLLAVIVMLMIPLAIVLPTGAQTGAANEQNQTLAQALREALAHRGFVLLTVGFFVCGFHVAFITDEIQTGVGRTGRHFAYQHESIRPDILTLGKGIGGGVLLSAMLASERACVFAAGDQGGTYNGNPLMAAVGLAVINSVCTEQFLQRVQCSGILLQNKLSVLAKRYGLSDVRGKGLLVAVDLKEANAPAIQSQAFELGLLINAPRPHTLRLMPALNVGEEKIDQAVELLEKAIQMTDN